MQNLYKLTTVTTTTEVIINNNDILTYAISGSGTVQAEIKITEDDDAVWHVAQICVDGTVYGTISGARKFRFNQTAASGETICEVSGANL